MRIAVNALSVQSGGGLTFLKNLLSYLPAIQPNNEFLVLVTQPKAILLGVSNRGLPNLKTVICPARGWVARSLWEQTVLPVVLRKEKVDILYAPGNQGPILFPCPFVVLIQNVDPLVQELEGTGLRLRLKQMTLRIMMHVSVYRARKVIAISEYTRQLIAREFRLASHEVAVVPHGSPKDTESLPDPEVSVLLQEAGITEPYFLSVSNIKYNKNYEGLIAAFAIVRQEISHPIHLVIAGEVEHRRCFSRIQTLIQDRGIAAWVRFLGGVDPKTLRSLYAGCVALVFPSKIESFGLPPLEAMAYGVPVVASRIEPVVEVCGDAAMYFDPHDPREIAAAMVRLLTRDGLRGDLIQRGLLRARRFSWEETACRTLAVLQSAI